VADEYVFDTRILTNHQPYFAAYIKVKDLLKFTDRLELVQDEWGYLLLWATLGIAAVFALTLVLFPVIFGWRTIFSRYPGKAGTMVYFLCLGLGYIIVEVGMISHFILALSNATVSASVLITGMLVFSGIGSFFSERFFPRARTVMPRIFLAIFLILTLYAFTIDYALDWIGTLPYALRIVLCLLLLLPPAFLMGFPMPTAMTALGQLGKDHMFLWAWGINGSFSVIGAAIVPIVARLDRRPDVRPMTSEVDRVLYVPLRELFRDDTYRQEIWWRPPMEWPIHFFELDDETVWGATARVLHQLLRIAHGIDGGALPMP